MQHERSCGAEEAQPEGNTGAQAMQHESSSGTAAAVTEHRSGDAACGTGGTNPLTSPSQLNRSEYADPASTPTDIEFCTPHFLLLDALNTQYTT